VAIEVKGLEVQAWWRCGRDTCELGATHAQPTDGDTATMKTLVAVFQKDSAAIELTITLRRPGRLKIAAVTRVAADSTAVATREFYEMQPVLIGDPDKAAYEKLPEFPWPPPRPSSGTQVTGGFVVEPGVTRTYGDAFARLRRALIRADFPDFWTFGIPDTDGFVVVTQLENFRKSDGRPIGDRFAFNPRPDRPRTLGEYIKALLWAPEGLYRIIALVVTSGSLAVADSFPTEVQVQGWMGGGVRSIPGGLRDRLLPADAQCEALIYEFKRPRELKQNAKLVVAPGVISGRTHLAGAGLWTIVE